jgi:hypothetical protein
VNLIDKIAAWIREVLAFLPPDVVDVIWFPVLVTVVFIAAMLLIRRLLPLLGRLAGASVRVLAALAGAVLLVPDMIVATACRSAHKRPPAMLYHYGDAVATSMIGVTRTSGAVSSGLARVARINVLLVMLGCAAVIWTWNHGHCPEAPATTECVRPFTSWVDTFDDEDQAPPAPGNSPSPSPPPNPK